MGWASQAGAWSDSWRGDSGCSWKGGDGGVGDGDGRYALSLISEHACGEVEEKTGGRDG